MTDDPCGTCKVCCKVLIVSSLDPPKDAGEWCQHCDLKAAKGCRIYVDRPQQCAVYQCFWRQGFDSRLAAIPGYRPPEIALRPDHAKVMLHSEPPKEDAPRGRLIVIETQIGASSRPKMQQEIMRIVKQGIPAAVVSPNMKYRGFFYLSDAPFIQKIKP